MDAYKLGQTVSRCVRPEATHPWPNSTRPPSIVLHQWVTPERPSRTPIRHIITLRCIASRWVEAQASSSETFGSVRGRGGWRLRCRNSATGHICPERERENTVRPLRFMLACSGLACVTRLLYKSPCQSVREVEKGSSSNHLLTDPLSQLVVEPIRHTV